MKYLLAIFLAAISGCTSNAQSAAVSESRCKSDAELAAVAEKTALAVQQAISTNRPLPTNTADTGKTPAQLAQEAALEAAPCDSYLPASSSVEIPQVDRVPDSGSRQ
jgi:hypothetical protein